jgi:hypothetical protein
MVQERRSKNRIISTITTIVRIRRILTDSLSVPTVMGNGPISITPATFALCFILTVDIIMDRKTIANPMMINITPTRLSEVQSNICSPV